MQISSKRSNSQSTSRIPTAKSIPKTTPALTPSPTPSPIQNHHSSLSLPRINQLSHQHPPSSLLLHQHPMPAIHKVRWSIAPRCLLPQHQSRQILYICISPGCTQPTRLACETCFFTTHSHHQQQFLALDEIKNATFDKLRFWPFDKQFKPIHEFIRSHENYVGNLVQDINATFDTMTRNILTEINKLKLDLLKQVDTFYVTETSKKQFVEELERELEGCFQLRRIRRVVSRLFAKEIKHSVWMMEMEKLLNSEKVIKAREKLMRYFGNAEKGRDMVFDKNTFLKRQSWIIEQIHQQKQTLEIKDVKTFSQISLQHLLPPTLTYLESLCKSHPNLLFHTVTYEDGSSYTGFTASDKRQIIGIRYYKNGTRYLGEWRNNSRCGWGTLINDKSGWKYSGEWSEDRRNGYGREQSFTAVYEGQWKNDKKQGFGVLVENGGRLEIGWKNDKKHGKGKIIRQNGEEVDVYFLNGVEAPAASSKTNAGVVDLKELSKRFSKKSESTKD